MNRGIVYTHFFLPELSLHFNQCCLTAAVEIAEK
jgi:hypothetical protein